MHKHFSYTISENHIQNSVGLQKKLKMTMTLHAPCMGCHWHRMHNACGIIDTTCTFNERFEQPWQPLKGISIKNINVPELSYPTTKKIYKFKGAT
jgi:hypothetical protein